MDLFEYFLVIPPLPLEVEVEVEVVSLLFDFLGIGNNFSIVILSFVQFHLHLLLSLLEYVYL